MIEIEDLSFREWECFEHLASQREENRISVPVTLGQSGRIRSTEMVEAKNLDLVPDVTDFQPIDVKTLPPTFLRGAKVPICSDQIEVSRPSTCDEHRNADFVLLVCHPSETFPISKY